MNTFVETQAELLAAAREAYRNGDWRAAYAGFERAGGLGPLPTDDLDAMATAAWRLGNVKETVRIAELVFTRLARTDPAAAAMKATELSLAWLTRGDVNIGLGWMNRARRLLGGATEGPAHGYLAYLEAIHAVMARDRQALAPRVAALREIGGRLDVPAITALSLLTEGLAAILDARTAEGYGLIDEAMLPVLADQVPIEWAGDIYCVVLHHCHLLGDLPRMRAWTQAMEQWSDLSGSVTYGGVCYVHRLQLQAACNDQCDYRQLEDRLLTASQALADVNGWTAAEGFYQLGEVRRRLGDPEGALAAFARARSLGMDPQPGEALLRCGLGDKQAAWTALRVALMGQDGIDRMRMLRAAVDVALAQENLDEADRHCRELEDGAAAFGTPGFKAWAAHARGAVLVRRERHAEALEQLGAALREYRHLQARYETAEVYEWMALAHRGLGDETTAAADSATAAAIYDQLGVEPGGICGTAPPGGLTKREIDVLKRIAAGATNRQVAAQLYLSEKTVGRHLANIYTKLGVSSRTAAANWAFQNKLLQPPD